MKRKSHGYSNREKDSFINVTIMKGPHTSLLSRVTSDLKKISDLTVEAVTTVSTLSAVRLNNPVAKQEGFAEEKNYK